jgi:hypothetical protein
MQRSRALLRSRLNPVMGSVVVFLLVAGLMVRSADAAEFVHYPGSWFDDAQTRIQGAFAAQRGVVGFAVYASNERFERVEAFYRQFLYPLPSAAGGMQRFCLDPVAIPQECQRFVELSDLSGLSGVGTRITVYQLR